MRNYLKLGDWNSICDRCGFKYKASQLKKEWTGVMVCSHCWEIRHPQTLIRVPTERGGVPWARPETPDVFIVIGLPILAESDIPITAEHGSILFTEQD